MRRALLPIVLLAACASGPREFAPGLGVDLAAMTQLPSGLYVQDLQVGMGEEAVKGSSVLMHYTGWLPNGEKFDSSRDRAEPLPVTLGRGEVIRGWDEGIVGMRVGGKRKLVIPPNLAYGNAGAGGVIPPGATLVFEVELVAVR